MAVSPWINFPTAFPVDGTNVWVRFREWPRQPFMAVWNDSEFWAGTKGQVTFNDDHGNVRNVPWQLLGAWHYV